MSQWWQSSNSGFSGSRYRPLAAYFLIEMTAGGPTTCWWRKKTRERKRKEKTSPWFESGRQVSNRTPSFPFIVLDFNQRLGHYGRVAVYIEESDPMRKFDDSWSCRLTSSLTTMQPVARTRRELPSIQLRCQRLRYLIGRDHSIEKR